MNHLTAFGAAIVLAGCQRGGDVASLRQQLDQDRRAHLETDANLLVANLADSLLSVSAGSVAIESREETRAFFRSYFAGARYAAWDDLAPPIVHVAPGGRSAWVVRQVRADREEPGLGGRVARRRFTGAWTATYEWRAGTWRMTSVTSTFVPDTPATRILAGAARAVAAGGTEPIDAVRASADAEGRGSRFQVTVTSRRSGEARIEFSTGLRAGIDRDTAWWAEPGRPASALDGPREAFLRGHELHLTLLAPDSRVREPAFTGEVELHGTPALRLSGVDATGTPIELFFGARDTLPLGMRVDDRLRGGGPVTVSVGDWVEQEGRRLFQRAEFRQGREVFRYRFTAVEVNPPSTD